MSDLARFYKFTVRDIPPDAQPWPADLSPPRPLGAPVAFSRDGLYYRCYADGQLELLVRVFKQQSVQWMNLEHGVAAGCDTDNSVHCAQRYYADGRMEDFNPWNDSDPAYAADETFESFVRRQLKLYFRKY